VPPAPEPTTMYSYSAISRLMELRRLRAMTPKRRSRGEETVLRFYLPACGGGKITKYSGRRGVVSSGTPILKRF
jgi:hypothetical protein